MISLQNATDDELIQKLSVKVVDLCSIGSDLIDSEYTSRLSKDVSILKQEILRRMAEENGSPPNEELVEALLRVVLKIFEKEKGLKRLQRKHCLLKAMVMKRMEKNRCYIG